MLRRKVSQVEPEDFSWILLVTPFLLPPGVVHLPPVPPLIILLRRMATNQISFTKAVLDLVLAGASANPPTKIFSIHVRPHKHTYTLRIESGEWTKANGKTIFALLSFLSNLNGKSLIADKKMVLGPCNAAPGPGVAAAPATEDDLLQILNQYVEMAVWMVSV